MNNGALWPPLDANARLDGDKLSVGTWSRGLTASVHPAADQVRFWIADDNDEIWLCLTLYEARALGAFLVERIPQTEVCPGMKRRC